MNRLLKRVIIVAAAALFSTTFIAIMPQVVTVILLGGLGVYIIFRKVDKDMRTRLIFLFVAAFIIHIFLSMHMYSRTVDTKYYGFSYKGDDYSYGDFGKIAGDLWRRGIFLSLDELKFYSLIGKPGSVALQYYQIYNAAIFYLYGVCAGQILLMLNCFFYALTILPVYFLCRELEFGNGVTLFTLCLFLFWPSTFYWSLFNFKEPLILAGFMSFSASCMYFQKNPGFRNMFTCILFLILLYSVKEAQMMYIIPAALLYFIFLLKWRYKGVLMLAVSAAFILRQILGEPITLKIYHLVLNAPTAFSNIRSTAYFMNTSYFWYISTDTYLKTILYFPLGVLTTMFLPFLLRPFSMMHIIANVESIIWWTFMPFLLGGIWAALGKELRKMIVILFIFLSWIGMLSLSQANMGTLIRQKAIIYYIGFILIGLGIDRARKIAE